MMMVPVFICLGCKKSILIGAEHARDILFGAHPFRLYFDIGKGNDYLYHGQDRKADRQKKIENARTMKSLNISSEVIHQVTGLPIKDIEEL